MSFPSRNAVKKCFMAKGSFVDHVWGSVHTVQAAHADRLLQRLPIHWKVTELINHDTIGKGDHTCTL